MRAPAAQAPAARARSASSASFASSARGPPHPACRFLEPSQPNRNHDESKRRNAADDGDRLPRPRGLPRRARREAARERARARDPHRRVRHLRERLQVPRRREDVLGRAEPVGQGARDSRPRVLRLRRGAGRGRGRALRRRARRSRDRRADRAVRHVPLLQVGPVLDVRGPSHLRLSARGRRRRDGRVHAHTVGRDRPPGPARHLARGRGDHRAARVRDPHGQPRRRPARRRRRDRGRGPARPDDDAGREAEDAQAARRRRSRRSAARARARIRRRRDDRSGPRGRARDRARADGGLRLRRLHRDDRRAGGRHAGHGADPQARPLRRVLGVRQGYGARLVDHRRSQGARRARRASRPVLLSCRDRSARARARHVEGHRHARASRSTNGTRRSGSRTRSTRSRC
ncbi:putative l-iditol 2-dehydrogenase [Burkholderia pseudomallei MSHR684]|nr:putative l-iditol 2-dehydrogenase [Burkholderia pseudomallei MSHR684]